MARLIQPVYETRWPGPDDRTVILGSTGSGKTTLGAYLLCYRDWLFRPWFIFNFKQDKLLLQFPAKEIAITAPPPREPGLYIINVLPNEEELVSIFLYKCWLMENCGIYIDEGTMVGFRDKWFRACLTQGRSKYIEMIILSQRPVSLDKYVFTEATFFGIFNLNWIDDRKSVEGYLNGEKVGRLDRFNFRWYDVNEQQMTVFGPVPTGPEIIALLTPPDTQAAPVGEPPMLMHRPKATAI